jgi:hypothetical protein
LATTGQVTVTLHEQDLLELWQVLVDDDEAGALRFLKLNLLPRIPAGTHAACDSNRLNAYLLKPSGR